MEDVEVRPPTLPLRWWWDGGGQVAPELWSPQVVSISPPPPPVQDTHSTVQYSTVQYSTVQYSIVQYSTVLTWLEARKVSRSCWLWNILRVSTAVWFISTRAPYSASSSALQSCMFCTMLWALR